ncbi:uncharacterized protein LOC107632039 isoform X1 [Arachis ipaensis]|uniref:J domain-containing protein n=1 Tax=Arachis hypogaea TaxID=3818 RepID=A0A445DLK0_ARAHY|nr:uncharacterized protein LOC107632039 isoform X1 [Arachis ipaensis]XP_025640026.1 uncharacterized protein LOC112734783 isoform X1 [Arachis hypogaea]QHO60272.1 J domain-containing protein required for chloroplast accumulation response [Arachis hypogaea]RYR64073.1 hypothetical protein Ahy_A03g010218 [Arachis hypogaea]
MDESCRIGTGIMRGLPRRRSVEDRWRRRSIFSGSEPAVDAAEDFADVFGGPPRTLLAHKYSNSGSSFYEEVFRPPEFVSPATRCGRNLPVFRIPSARNNGFYSDIFGSDDERRSRERSRSQSKGTSSSVLSSEELSPRRPAIGDDVALSGLASKLSDFYRPISVPWRWDSSSMMPEEYPDNHGVPTSPCDSQSVEFQFPDNEFKEIFKSSNLGSSRRVTSPETISFEYDSYQSVKGFTDDWELNSPISVVSSLRQESEAKYSVHDGVLKQQTIEDDDDDYDEDEDEVMSSYVIELNSNLRREDCEASAIDEAIAWAKEKFQSGSSDEGSSSKNDSNEQTAKTKGSFECHDDEIEIVESPKKPLTETEKLDRDIRLWSSGKETDIRLLLSTLHHVLWPESGWYAVPLMSLIESSKVKKAYQKARLCLHPDKLQQRGATVLQKYVAEKVFSILQDAWAAFISMDVSFLRGR